MRVYRQISLYKARQAPKIVLSSRLAAAFVQYNQSRCYVENTYVVGAAPTDDAPTISKLSAMYCLLRHVCIRSLTVFNHTVQLSAIMITKNVYHYRYLLSQYPLKNIF